MFDRFELPMDALPAELIERATVLLDARRALDAELARVVGLIEAEKLTDAVLGLSTREFVSRTGGLSMRTARRLTSVGRALVERFDDAVRERLASGSVGVEHLEVIVRHSNERIEPTWSEQAAPMLDLADDMTFTAWERTIAALARRVDEDGAYDPKDDAECDRLRLSRSGNWLKIDGRFFGESAELLETALTTMDNALFRQFWSEHRSSGTPVPSRASLLGTSLVELVRRGNLVNADGAPRSGAVEATFVVTAEDREPVVRTRDGRVVDESAFGCLLCDPTVRAAVVDSLGRPLDVGRALRLANDDMRAAISVRDGGCVFPGCASDAVVPVDAHHVHHFLQGGETAVHNLASLCRRHHGIVHRSGWAMFITDDGWTVFRRPDGTLMWGQQYGVQRQGPIPDVPQCAESRCSRPVDSAAASARLERRVRHVREARERRTARTETRVVHGGYGGGGGYGGHGAYGLVPWKGLVPWNGESP